jgi:glucosamine kinase
VSRSVLVIDLGKTGCRAALWVGEQQTHAAGPGSPGLASRDGAALAEAAILAVARPLLRDGGRIDLVCAGVAGAMAAPDAARALARRLCDALPSAEAAVTSDAVTSHAGALGGEPGTVLAAGTGAVAIAVAADGALRRTDGWGPWLGDEGGGAWIGLRGLRAALRAADGRGPATLLQAAAEAGFGPLAGLAAVMEGHDSPARLAASFAPAVARAAEAGDGVAITLMRRAAQALAATARAAGGTQTCPVAITGGLAKLGPALLDPLQQALGAGLLQPAGTALDGARYLALRRDTLHEHLIIRAYSLVKEPECACST